MKTNKYINASYQLFDVTDGQNELIEETSADQPFTFVSGLGMLLEAFEQQVVDLEPGAKFDFTLTPEQAYGEFSAEHVVELDKQLFVVEGHFDDKNVFKDAIIPLQNEDGNMFTGRVEEITADKVKIDLNHPLAGKSLRFCGSIVESREATNEELSEIVGQITGQGEGCGCGGNCGGDCNCGGEGHHGEGHDHHCDGHGKHGDGEGHCCGKHHHEDGHCCGKHHHE